MEGMLLDLAEFVVVMIVNETSPTSEGNGYKKMLPRIEGWTVLVSMDLANVTVLLCLGLDVRQRNEEGWKPTSACSCTSEN